MTRSRAAVLFAVLVVAAVALATQARAGFFTQRDQIAVAIVVNVTPAPIVYRPTERSAPIIARFRLRARGSAAQVDAQKALKVQAEVTPNPNATLLYSDQQVVTMNATAGTTVTRACAYHVTVSTTVQSWTLNHGLSADFSPSFGGGDLSNNSYLSTPHPGPTPFVVYADDNHVWAVLGSSGGIKTYCVDLSLTIPASVAGGTYSTNAVYTLYF